MDILTLFGRHLRKIRKERSLTQEDLAGQCGVYTQYIGEIERGEKNPTLITLHKLSTGLNLPLPELLAIPQLAQNESGKILAMVSEVNPKKKKGIYNAIKLMVD